MAVIEHGTYTVGDVVKLWPQDETLEHVDVVAPDGQQMRIGRVPPGPARISVFQPGEWTYRWSDSDHGTLTVAASAPVPSQPRWHGG